VAETGVDAARVQVLGPVRVAGPAGWVDVPGVNGKALIVSLVLAKGAVVSVPSLVDDIWQDDPPRNARAALQTLVSRVRAVAGDELIESVAGGYRLGASAAEVDLWSPESPRRGEPGADLGDTELAGRLRETADGVRVRALETRVTDALRSGAPAEAVEAARALADATPYDERAQLMLMKSLAADGRRGEALRAFAEFRRRLDDELGARPGAELVAFNAELLRDDTALDRDPGAPPASATRASDPSGAQRNLVAQAGGGGGSGGGGAAPKHVAIGLRAAPNQLIGRDGDIAALEKLMAQARLTTILGPGGLGKTRLAQELANRAAATTPGVVVVELAGIRESDDVPLAVAATLGLGEVGAGRLSLRDPIVLLEVRTRIRAALAERETLLVLDNCEHVVEGAAALVDQVLSEIPTVRVLATSRAPLQLGAESVYPLGPLPADQHGPAVALFLERARAARPGAALPVDAVARLCEHLDGLPLAIELAAARIRSMSVDEIERRLSNRFALLRGGDRSAPERHRTLIAVIDWSWNLLSESERRMLRRLSRFPDGFSAVAAAAVVLIDTAGTDEESARLAASDDLDALVLQSLVSVTEGPTGLRYRMLETVREFGDMALVDAGEDELVATAQARWAQRFGAEFIAALPTSRQSEALLAVGLEHDNLVTVLRAHDDDPETVVPVFAALLFHWMVRNQFREALSFAPVVARAVAVGPLPEHAPDATAITLMFAAVMGVAGSQAPRPGQRGHEQQPELPPELEEYQAVPPGQLLRAGLRAGVKMRRLVRSGAVSPWLVTIAEMAAAAVRNPAEWSLDQLDDVRRSDDEVVRTLGNLFSGLLTENTGELERALDYVHVAWQGASRLGLDWVAGQAAQGLANLSSQDDRPRDTLEWAARARDKLAMIGAVEEIGQFDWITAINKLKLGRRDGVAEAFERFASEEGSLQEGFDGLDARAIGWAGLGELAAADGDPTQAVERYRAALRLYGPKPGPYALGAWYLISGAGALAASVYYDRMDDDALAIWRTQRLATRLSARGRGRGGPAMVDRPVLATAALGLAIWLLGAPGVTDAGRTAGAELIAFAERLHSRQDQPVLVRARAFALAERVVGASVVASARARVAAFPDLAAATRALDELLRRTRV
jgi:predicted ATPase/DNA-binding SARP family transcriptional activator/tetratricopeptide (TPR) repeat protein